MSCHGFFPTGHKEFRSLPIIDSTLPPTTPPSTTIKKEKDTIIL
jgi:hypothetical protein